MQKLSFTPPPRLPTGLQTSSLMIDGFSRSSFVCVLIKIGLNWFISRNLHRLKVSAASNVTFDLARPRRHPVVADSLDGNPTAAGDLGSFRRHHVPSEHLFVFDEPAVVSWSLACVTAAVCGDLRGPAGHRRRLHKLHF